MAKMKRHRLKKRCSGCSHLRHLAFGHSLRPKLVVNAIILKLIENIKICFFDLYFSNIHTY